MTLLTVMLTTATAWAATENLGGHNFTVSSKLHSGTLYMEPRPVSASLKAPSAASTTCPC